MTARARKIDARSQFEVSVRSVWPVLAHARSLGIDTQALLCAAGLGAAGLGAGGSRAGSSRDSGSHDGGLDAASLQDGDARISHATLLAIWDAAARVCGDDALGLHAAEQVRPGMFDALDYALRTSATLGEALRRLTRYHRVIHDAALVRLQIDGDIAWLTHALPAPIAAEPLPRHVAEYIIALWLLAAREMTGLDFTPHDVCFRHAAPPDRTEHDRLFGIPARFSGPVNGFAMPRALLDRALVKADPGLSALLERFLDAALQHRPLVHTVADRVRRLLASGLSTGTRVDLVARSLRMSRRTLHRQLAEEGTSFAELLDALRRDLAGQYLTEARLAIAEIAFLLGFSEPSAFHRAFRRWYGAAPGEYRRRASAQ